jgi:hypothetical protein
MDASFELTVTEDDLLHGTAASPTDCAIARAAKRLYPDKEVFVCPAILILKDADGRHEFSIPQAGRRLLQEFDATSWDDFDRLDGAATFTLTRYEPRPKGLSKAVTIT